MALSLVSHGDKVVALGYDSATGERGFLVKFINRTGGVSVKGTPVHASSTTDKEVIYCDDGFDCFGIVQEAGIAEGSEMWAWMNGSVCEVLFEDGVAPARGYVALGSNTVPGRAEQVAVPSSNPVSQNTSAKWDTSCRQNLPARMCWRLFAFTSTDRI